MKLLENERIVLRALEPEDLEVLFRWENDASLWELGSTLSPFSRYVLKEYIATSHQDIYTNGQLRLMIVCKETGEPVGTIDLFDLDPHHRRCGVGILIDPDSRRKGFAGEALLLVLAYAFSFLKLKQVYAHVPVNNHPSVALFTRSGFKITGRLSQWISTPTGYSDVFVMQYLFSEMN
ncbi:MAG: GNAT family N-acetyltransferase [Parabacteroides sp.]|jgi:diamine N-acetyltransferase|nr:GNAT family N-acetyltransferase [Parabacteroides sp.]MBP9481797.1 GNAT family N-acetyltransferase [Parabacteroides sp.]MDD2416062.1 GNAT family N-acetyltransferase [Parabacteroides sp.]MDD3357728.1 GNAT family N-acetyltransferase [Parabacteroides sp.]MDD4404913.1 GNAT family N-acetyltransferase [Parabacteroides sp.]